MQCKAYWPGIDSPCLFLSVSSQSRELCRALPTDSKKKKNLSEQSSQSSLEKCHK